MSTFVVISAAGPGRDLSLPTREQPFWDEHAVFIDELERSADRDLRRPEAVSKLAAEVAAR